MFTAIYDFDINLLYDTAITCCVCVSFHFNEGRERHMHVHCDITGYVIINRFITIPCWIYCFSQMCELCTLRYMLSIRWVHRKVMEQLLHVPKRSNL